MPKSRESDNDTTRRSFGRMSLGIAARLETLHGRKSVRLVDLSQGGAQIIVPPLDFNFREGVLMWRGFEYYCRVAWIEDDRIGVVFAKPLPLKVIITMRNIMPSILREESMTDELTARSFVNGSPHLGADR